MTHEHHLSERPDDPACDVAHGTAPPPPCDRALVAVFDTPVARFLLRYARDAGYQVTMVDPGPAVPPDPPRAAADGTGFAIAPGLASCVDPATDVVVTDHHRPELGPLLRDALAGPARWIGIMGNPRHPAPHIPALRALGVPAGQIERVHRPIGLNIGSHTPAEIAIATLAGLIADRNGRPGGFGF